ncbi:MAG: alpha-galactosidase [Ruminococcaceae bacterium]|nr:alpha-galactosidase [Oscillospiraceae bacterium]
MINHDFFDISLSKNDDKQVISYRSGTLVYEETFYNGALLSSGYNSAGYPLNVLMSFPTRLNKNDFCEPFAFNIEIDGQSVDFDLEIENFETIKNESNIESVLTFKSNIKPIIIKMHTALDGTNVFSRYFEIENTGDISLNLSRLSLIAGGLETLDRDKIYSSDVKTDEIYSIGYFDSDKWGEEGLFNWHRLDAVSTSIDTRFNRDRFRQPVIFLRNNVTGKIWVSEFSYSGGCRFTFDLNAQNNTDAHLSFKAEITGHKPLYVIAPNETFISPEIQMGLVGGDLDTAVNELHAHIRKSVLNVPEINPVNLLIGCGMGAEHLDMGEKICKDYIRQFKEMGGEVFIVDAGWVCPKGEQVEWGNYNGLNVPNKELYPDGITEIVDYCHSLGLKFGLWMDVESLGKLCPQFKENPEWRANNILNEQTERFIDFTVKEAAEWCESELERVIVEYKLDLLRVDYNTSYRDYFNMRDTGTGVTECLTLKHFYAVYKMYENLKKKFPNVIFENCAGGGGRCDLSQMKHFNHTWGSDCQRAPKSIYITNGMTMCLPPERVDRLFAGMGCHEHGSLDLQLRNTMLGHMSLNVIAPMGAEINKNLMEFVKHSTDIYKEFIRPMLPDCLIYHHTPETDTAYKNGFSVLEIASPDKTKGAIAVFSTENNNGNSIVIKPKGASISKNYKVTLDNDRASFNISGYSAINNGILINLNSAMISELILFEEN